MKIESPVLSKVYELMFSGGGTGTVRFNSESVFISQRVVKIEVLDYNTTVGYFSLQPLYEQGVDTDIFVDLFATSGRKVVDSVPLAFFSPVLKFRHWYFKPFFLDTASSGVRFNNLEIDDDKSNLMLALNVTFEC